MSRQESDQTHTTARNGWVRGAGLMAGAFGAFVLALGAAPLSGASIDMDWLEPSAAWAQSDGESEEASDESEESDENDETSETSNDGKAPASMSADDVAKRIQKFYGKTSDYQAAFKQVYTDVAAGEEKKKWGRVYFKKPGRMRWDYYSSDDLDDREKTLVSDGKVFWIYELEFKQVFKRCLTNSQLPVSLKFLMGQGNLLEEFDIEFTDASTEDAPELELVPKEDTPKYKKLRFRVDPETFQVKRTTIYDPYGNTNQFEFDDALVNKNLRDDGFEFEPPEDARLLNSEKDCE